jgi:hypothetical protein
MIPDCYISAEDYVLITSSTENKTLCLYTLHLSFIKIEKIECRQQGLDD